MAKTEVITSDIDGATPARTMTWVLFGKSFSVDLTEEQGAEFDQLVARFAAFVEAGKLKRLRVAKEQNGTA